MCTGGAQLLRFMELTRAVDGDNLRVGRRGDEIANTPEKIYD